MPLTRLLDTLRSDIFSPNERGVMTRSTAAIAAFQLTATVISFGSSLLYARVLGPHGFGLYAYVIAWANLLAIPVALGMPSYLVREGSGRMGVQPGLRRWADVRVLAAGIVVMAALAGAYWVPIVGNARILFLIASPIPLLTAFGQVRQALLATMKLVATSQWPLALGPLVILLTMFALWLIKGDLLPAEVMAAALAAAALILLISHIQLRRVMRGVTEAARPTLNLHEALPFMVMGMLFLINNRADIIILGSLRGPHDAGIYAIVARAGAMVAFALAAVDMVIAPRIAAYYRAGDRSALQRLLTASSRRALIFALPLAGVFLVAASPLLGFLYGDAYVEGASALRILTIGYLVTVALGSATVTINMAGKERLTLWSVGMAVALNILLNFALIPIFGMDGAAIATASSLLLFSLSQWFWARRRIGFRPSVFGL